MNRRHFLQTGALAAGALALDPTDVLARKPKTLGLQLYTLRAELDKDLAGTLKAVADAGYTQVEGFATKAGHWFGKKAPSFKYDLDELKLRMISAHVPLQQPGSDLPTLVNKTELLFEEAKKIGLSYLVVPYLDKSERTNLDAYKVVAEKMNKAGELAKAYDLNIAYHNHAFEFETLEGRLPWEVLAENTEPRYVKFELDLYWAVKANQQPIDLFKKHRGRVHLWHVKDMGKAGDTVEVGAGTIDFAAIYREASLSGMRYAFVEQDKSANPLASIKQSAEYLKNQFSY